MKLNRTTPALQRQAKQDDNTIEMAISSEAPVERWFGIEVLRHSKGAIDLARLADGRHPLLLNHRTDSQIGVIERAWLDDDKKLRGEARFSRSELGQEIQQDVQDEIRTLISVGYEIHEVEEQKKNADGELVLRTLTGDEFEREMRAQFGENFYRAGPAACRKENAEPPTYIVTRWCPFEVSVVPVPADVAVGVGRSAEPTIPPATPESPVPAQPKITLKENRTMNQKTELQLETERRDAIIALGDQYQKYVGQKEVSEALRNQHTLDQFRDTIMQKMESCHTTTAELHIGMERKDIQKYSFVRGIVASMTGDWSKAGLELEASRAVGKLIGRTPEGFFVPYDAFHRDFNVGTGSEAGNLVPTELRTDLFVDVLRNNLVTAKLGIRILVGLTSSIDIPKKATPSSLATAAEIAALSETNPTTAKVSLSPKRHGAFVEYSKQALIQSALAIEPMLRDDLLVGSAILIQDQIINGSGSGSNMRGIRNTTGIGSVVGGTNGLAPAWSHIVDLESVCANANAEPDQFAGYLVNTKTRGKLKQTVKGTNLPFIWDNGPNPLNGYRALVTNTVPSNLTKGTSTTVCSSLMFGSDWSMAVLGMFGAPDVTVDPLTLATTGQVRITLNTFGDFGVRQAACFSSMEDALSS
jgi:HK97 family phage major capsid protein